MASPQGRLFACLLGHPGGFSFALIDQHQKLSGRISQRAVKGGDRMNTDDDVPLAKIGWFGRNGFIQCWWHTTVHGDHFQGFAGGTVIAGR